MSVNSGAVPARAVTTPPKVSLNRGQWVRFIIVATIASFAVLRVLPDIVRAAQPLGFFSYATNANGIVVSTPPKLTKDSERLLAGDRVRIDRIKEDDRKPGIAGIGFTREDFERQLPIERAGKLRSLHLVASEESVSTRATAVVRIAIFVLSVFLGALLFLLKPSIATAAFFVFCLGGEYPTTFADAYYPQPWREIPRWLGDTLRGFAAPALLLFAIGLYNGRLARRALVVIACVLAALALGSVHAYADWARDYAALPAEHYAGFYRYAEPAIMALSVIVFGFAYRRADRAASARNGAIFGAFVVSIGAAILSAWLFPEHLPPWLNGVLQTAPIIPIAVVWFAVIRHKFFNVDFVVGRGIVFLAITAVLFGIFLLVEDLGTYFFANNSNVEYTVFFAIVVLTSSTFGIVRDFIHKFVDRFLFRGRHNQRVALEYIAGYILDSESADDVYRAILEDARGALNLSFAGVFMRKSDGSFELDREHLWPDDLRRHFDADDPFVRQMTRSRNVLTFSAKESAALGTTLREERFSFAAPIFSNRTMSAVVIFGPNLSSLDLDPDERELLVSIVSHASIALSAIELASYREALALSAPLLDSG
ncbi:MAG: hypothetical protein GIW95_06035 [Candidatus Eremiobacteraeota bacterium]|nr:hypothetical protein [Candidatus Eremiobacteraeota bacterium]